MKDCPFCGGKNIDVMGTWEYSVQCRTCGAVNGNYENENAAISAWNDRAYSWDILMEILEKHYPADLFGGEDALFKASENIGCAIVEKLREIDALRKSTVSRGKQ